ncbi:hypothetical protein [Helicobacter canis]|uniref:Uncharacterized protein n=1 Tax=Helicobacter canis NCTC 12740 TaxID=1357399 RepID=V8CJQ0_9HELI|nr:hypothetical protein [Helicobacter canis]ETD27322.1 hypothetical protein HMPREF2087_00234 [Helicobacter canis NCTC 12740]
MNFVRCEKKHKGVTLSGNDRRAFLTLAQKSQKAESLILLLVLALAVGGCTSTKREAVYIPTKCKTKPIPKPTPSKDSSISQDVAEILAYAELVERDLAFCRGER